MLSNPHRRGPVAAVVLTVLLAACIGVAACGGSSSSSSSAKSSPTTASASSASSGSQGGGPSAGRFAAMRACLQKNGITLPQRSPGTRRPNGGVGGFLGGAGGSPHLPKGVTRTQYQAALKKCAGANFAAGRGGRLNNPAFKQVLAKFATCLRQNGVNVPAPNTSGTGPVFNTKDINTRSAKFKAAESKCQSALRGTFGRRPGGAGVPPGGPGGSGGAPGARAGSPST
jgi:hypothetical protein